jgi:sugar phosphate isomerase/epimerase
MRIALSSWVCKYPDDLLEISTAHGFDAIEWDLNYIPMPLSRSRRRDLAGRLADCQIQVRFHLPYSMWELAHESSSVRSVSLDCLRHTVDLVADAGGDFAILHFASESKNLPPDISGLEILSEHCRAAGVALAIENLLSGITSQPLELCALARQSRCSIALDVGHASHGRSAPRLGDFFKTVGSDCRHVHFYGSENEMRVHLPFRDPELLRTVVRMIAKAAPQADWWTCEMDDLQACLDHRDAIRQVLID